MKKQFLTFMLICFTSMLAFSQTVDAGLYPGICPGESLTLTGTVSGADPDGYCAKWTAPDGMITYGLTVTISPTMTGSYIFQANFNDGNTDYDEALISVCEMEIHPVDSDFNPSNRGKLLIWTQSTDNKYWTTKKTTKDDKPAQSEDRRVKITVHMTPASDNVGKVVYFRVVDTDDASPYEAGTTGGDNKGPMGVLTGTTNGVDVYDVATMETINGTSVAAAEVELEFTNQYSGDNYQVEASLDPHFTDPAQTLQTVQLTAWKRVYVEEDNMLLSGATIIDANVLDVDSMDDVLKVDNTADFTVGDAITLFNNAGVTASKTVKAKTATTITVEDMAMVFDKYSGVSIDGATVTYSINPALFTAGYGGDAAGTDGGAFVEFEWGYSGSQSIPKYTTFPADMWVTAIQYGEYWFNNSGGGNNIFQMVAAAGNLLGAFGVANQSKNVTFTFIDNFSFGAGNIDAIAETAVHEIGHQLGVSNTHVDASLGVNNHNGSDKCNMSYDRIRDNAIVEFDLDCLYDIRDGVVPL